MRRAFELVGLDKQLEIKKATEIKLSEKEFIHFDKMDDGNWRMIWTVSTIPEIAKLEGIKIIRED